MNKRKNIYYPVTQYHFIQSLLLSKNSNCTNNYIILDESRFSQKFIDNVKLSENWKHVYRINKSKCLHDFISRNIAYAHYHHDIFNIKNWNIFIFTFGDEFINTFINSVQANNNIILGEDGMFPYYGMEISKNYYELTKHELKTNKYKRIIKNIINRRSRFNYHHIQKIIVCNPEWLPVDILNNHEIETVVRNNNTTIEVFEELNIIYEYTEDKYLYNDIDGIYFDSIWSEDGFMDVHVEYKLLCNIFTALKQKKIYVKFKPSSEQIFKRRVALFKKIKKETLSDIVIDIVWSNISWEIMYYNNLNYFKDVFFIGNVSTATLTPKKFFGTEHNIIYINKIIRSEKITHHNRLDQMINRIKRSFIDKKIYTPLTIRELQNIIKSFE